MGRGLSELQRWILQEASGVDRLYYADICSGYFHWTRARNPGADLPGHQRFSRRTIGEQRYQAVMATLSRTCKRLWQRGLIEWPTAAQSHWAAVVVTDQGREWLKVNSRQILHQVNR
jgi:hypothetical protein